MSTSQLQTSVKQALLFALGPDGYVENSRPEWLYDQTLLRLELDFYIKDANCAIEVQGAQHYVYIPFFHGDWDGFKEQQARDEKKRAACKVHGITLFEISEEYQINQVVRVIRQRMEKPKLAKRHSYDPVPPHLLNLATELFNLLYRKGLSYKKKLKYGEVLLNSLVDAISTDPEMVNYEPETAKWVVDVALSSREKMKVFRLRKKVINERRDQRRGYKMGIKMPKMPRNFTRAKRRKIEEIPGVGYVVEGGREEHLVQVDETGFPICDCESFFELDYPCVHIWRYLKSYDYPMVCELRQIIRAEKLGGDA